MNNKTKDSVALRPRQRARTKDIKTELFRGGTNSKRKSIKTTNRQTLITPSWEVNNQSWALGTLKVTRISVLVLCQKSTVGTDFRYF